LKEREEEDSMADVDLVCAEDLIGIIFERCGRWWGIT
jgi:hypothetical protein